MPGLGLQLAIATGCVVRGLSVTPESPNPPASAGRRLTQFACVLLACGFALAALCLACTSAVYTVLPGEDASVSADCGGPPVLRCDAAAGVPACTVLEDAGNAYLKTAAPGTQVPLGCSLQFPSPTPLKRSRECIFLEQCSCLPGEAGSPEFSCTR